MLRGGSRAAVTVAVLTLRLRGAVGPGPGGTLRTTAPLDDAGADLPALTRAVHTALHLPADTRQLRIREGVALALVDLRHELTVAGLLRILQIGRAHV